MTTDLDAARRRAATTYNAAADRYDDPANTFWSRFGRATVDRLNLRPGDQVLDACCGTGASAIPAAEAVGPTGRVLAIDLAGQLLERGRARAAALGLDNVEFREGDFLDPALPEWGFDVVVCVFGIFFVPEMEKGVAALWRLVKPGGRLAITTWGPRLFEPANTAFWNSIKDVRPELHKGFNPWDRITTPASLVALLREGGVPDADAEAQFATHPIGGPDAWWALVMGSGYRGTVEQLTPEEGDTVRAANDDAIRRTNVESVEANVVYAVARRPAMPDHQDALAAAARHHRLLFENDRVRVLETRIPPGETTGVHTHCWPSVLYFLSRSPFVRRDGSGVVTMDSRTLPSGPAPPPDAAWLPALPPHSLENVGDRDLHVIGVEVKTAPGESGAGAR
jgi:ubiquinone/menaquinone biosynthesis C-methylase UbiE/mannose-6-phosphate isomerase-like protein (cupin superfamily)